MQSRNVHVLYLESCWHDSQCEGILQSINLEVLLHISASLLTRSKARGHIVKGHACLILKIFVIDLDKSWKIKTWGLLFMAFESTYFVSYKMLHCVVSTFTRMGEFLPWASFR